MMKKAGFPVGLPLAVLPDKVSAYGNRVEQRELQNNRCVFVQGSVCAPCVCDYASLGCFNCVFVCVGILASIFCVDNFNAP